MIGTEEALQEWIETFDPEWRRERRVTYLKSVLDDIGARLQASEHRFNMKYDADYRRKFYKFKIEEITEDLNEFYEFYDEQVREGREASWRLAVYGLQEIQKKENKLKWLKKMIQTKEAPKGLTDEMIESARDYPIENLVGEVGKNGMICCPFHDDKSPSMYVKNGFAYCFGCGKSLDSIAWVQEVDGVCFSSAVKMLSRGGVG